MHQCAVRLIELSRKSPQVLLGRPSFSEPELIAPLMNESRPQCDSSLCFKRLATKQPCQSLEIPAARSSFTLMRWGCFSARWCICSNNEANTIEALQLAFKPFLIMNPLHQFWRVAIHSYASVLFLQQAHHFIVFFMVNYII